MSEEDKTKPQERSKEIDPRLKGFIDRVIVPALVDRWHKEHRAPIAPGIRLTKKERLQLSGMQRSFDAAAGMRAIAEFREGITNMLESGGPPAVYRALAGAEALKSLFQCVHNYNHTLAMLAAKAFLEGEFPELPWEEIEFACDANTPGVDILIVRPAARIVGEVKTTEPCDQTKTKAPVAKFGSNQRKAIEKNLRSLAEPKYDDFARYMFVTSGLAYACLLREYRDCFPTTCFVLLSGSPEVSRSAGKKCGV
jgi:hypothetical protein